MEPVVFFFIIFVVFCISLLLKNVKQKPRSRNTHSLKSVKPTQPQDFSKSEVGKVPKKWGMSDPANQLEAIARVNFEKKRLLNKSEYRVFANLEKIVGELDQGHRVMAQTSLGELIAPKSSSGDWKDRKDAFASINSKRLDFAVIDKFGLLALAVEYQGSGHYHEKTFMRDAVKKEALRRAGVALLEVPKGMTPKELKQRVVSKLADKPVAAASSSTQASQAG